MLLAQVDLFALLVLYGDPARFVAAGPDDDVGPIDVLGLGFRVCRADQADPFFGTGLDVLVQGFRVAAQPRVRIHVLPFEGMLIEVLVALRQRFLGRLVEDTDLVPVDDRDIVALEMMRQVPVRVKAPVVVLKVTETLANALALQQLLLVLPVSPFQGLARATLFAVWIWLWQRVR